jgi:DNA polymerase-3 subunit epsilon
MAGLARFRGSELVETWRVLVDPEDHYEQLYHSDLHGIREQHTSEASTFPEIHPLLKHFLAKELCIFHAASGFDRECLRKACERYALENVTTSDWLSTL